MENQKMFKKVNEVSDYDIEISIRKILYYLGTPMSLKGYEYVKSAILLSTKDNDYLHNITTRLYVEVAKIHKTTSTRVERAIRHTVKRTWDSGNFNDEICIFGYTIRNAKYKPTNSEFVAMMVELVKSDLKISNYAI